VTGWLLDTNILSAFAPGKPALSRKMAAWFEERTDELFLSAIAVAEIEAGISKLDRTGFGRRADELRAWFKRMLGFYADRVLPFDLAAARIAGMLSGCGAGRGEASWLRRCRHRGDRQVEGARDPDPEPAPFRSARGRHAQSV
jgi:predicted nucleic acid-binding protein